MWSQNYTPVAGNLALSSLAAAMPIFILLFLLGVKRTSSWVAALSGLATAAVIAVLVYGMPVDKLFGAIMYGAANGLFPIGWVVFTAILLYRVTVEMGKFETLKDSVGNLSQDRRLQALLIAFAFGAFIEGAAGFGTPVAVAAAMLTGLGFSPFYAAGICLLANTAPVAFGSIGTPLFMLQTITKLPLDRLSAGVGRICAPVSLIVPAYLILVMGGWPALKGVLPAAVLCGVAFAGTQFFVSNFIGPELTDILASLAAIGSLIVLFKMWQPKDSFELAGEHTAQAAPAHKDHKRTVAVAPRQHTAGEVFMAWAPYLLLVIFVLAWAAKPVKAVLDAQTVAFGWPGLHNQIQQMPPVVKAAAPYAAGYRFNWLSAPGTACLFAAILSALILGMSPARFGRVFAGTVKQMLLPELTIASVLGLAFLMNYSGATATLGLAFAATGVMFPFFSAMLGWLGVFLTGSDTSANALFGNLQVITAGSLNLNPVLMAASNSSGGVMGKMISLQSVAVAAAATGMATADESKLFRFTLRHSILLASVLGLIVMVYAYVLPQFAP
ncbi:MAG TPA: lactate permease LctP family transporter [Bryobacteraceae bacterium]|nr:lactate permease LctP family transporter [Bryobacteraceae bacterium]